MVISECCNNCDSICNVITLQKLDELIYKSNLKITHLSEEILKSLYYGYYCDEDIRHNLSELLLYTESLNRLKRLIYNNLNSSCLCDSDIQRIIERTNNIVGYTPCDIERLDVNIDKSNYESYLMSSPTCVSYESWNKYSRLFCGELGFDISITDDRVCDITFMVSRDIVSCDLLYTLKVYEELCNLGYTINRTEQECKIDYNLLIEKYECDLSFRSYLKLIQKYNMSYSVIENIYKSGIGIKDMGKYLKLLTPMGDFKIKELTPKSLTKLSELGYKFTINKNSVLSDYKLI